MKHSFKNEFNELKSCYRCGGSGYIPKYDHVENGICFACRRKYKSNRKDHFHEIQENEHARFRSIIKESLGKIETARASTLRRTRAYQAAIGNF